MLSQKVIDYLKMRNGWFKDTEVDGEDYKSILVKLDIDLKSDFGFFYTYAEEYPGGFSSRDFELWQICWVYENGGYGEIREVMNTNLNLNNDYYIITEFEGESAYFYNKKTCNVDLIGYSDIGVCVIKSWASFNDFLEWYFELH